MYLDYCSTAICETTVLLVTGDDQSEKRARSSLQLCRTCTYTQYVVRIFKDFEKLLLHKWVVQICIVLNLTCRQQDWQAAHDEKVI